MHTHDSGTCKALSLLLFGKTVKIACKLKSLVYAVEICSAESCSAVGIIRVLTAAESIVVNTRKVTPACAEFLLECGVEGVCGGLDSYYLVLERLSSGDVNIIMLFMELNVQFVEKKSQQNILE